MRSINKIIVHCADTYHDMDIGVEEIRQWHLDRSFNDIGYHFVIRRDGTLEIGRPIDVQGAHVSGLNKHSIGICLVGGKPRFNFRDVQMNQLRETVRDLLVTYPDATVHGHNEYSDKACPDFDVQVWAEDNLKG